MTIWDEIQQERRKQAEQWGGASHDADHTPNDWIAYIAFHAGKGSYKADFRAQMIKVAALAVAAIEAHDNMASLKRMLPLDR